MKLSSKIVTPLLLLFAPMLGVLLYARRDIPTAVVFAIGLLIFCSYLEWSVIRPILRLTRMASALAQSDSLPRKLAPQSFAKDETGVLAYTLHDMAQKLHAAHELLEEEVTTKTQELADRVREIE